MSEFSRETLLNIIETDHVQCGEASALARMALSAMDSEPVEMPLDYLQGHKDGLEWASQLAEANHPETGDWLYDDPIELAKAIRKGPDMQPAQPAADSEPVAEVYQPQNAGICAPLGPSIRMLCPLEPGTNLYRHAQPAPVVPEEMPCGGAADDYHDGYQDGWNACRAAMLQELQKSAGDSNNCRGSENMQVVQVVQEKVRCGTKAAPTLDSSPKKAESRCGNSPVIPDGYVMVPKEPTAEMQSAGASAIRIETTALNKLWTGNAVFRAMLAAAPQEVKGE